MPVFRKIFARDPANPNDIASNATITLFDPADPNKTPVALTKLDGTALANPYTVNRQGEGPAFQHESLYIVGWEGGGHSGEFDSIESMHADTLAARTAAENSVLLAQDAQAAATNAGANAATEAVAEVESRIAAGDFKGPKGDTGLPGPDAIPADEAVAAYATTPGTATAAALSSTIADETADKMDVATAKETLAPALGSRPASRFVAIGDSIVKADDTPPLGRHGWPTIAAIQSGQKIQLLRNSGVPGDRTDQMLARFDADVAAYAPNLVAIAGGTNDVGQGINPTTTRNNLAELVRRVRAIGAVPVLCTIAPQIGTTAKYSETLRLNAWIRDYAAKNGITVIDFYTLLTNEATGDFVSPYGSGDGTHPSTAGYVAMGKHAASVLAPLVPPRPSILPVINNGPENKVVEGLFLAAPGAGGTISAPWLTQTGGVTGVTYTMEEDAAIPGKWAVITSNASTGFDGIIYQTISAGIPAMVGHRFAFTARIKTTGIVGSKITARVRWTATANRDDVPIYQVTADLDGIAYFEGIVPAGATQAQVSIVVSNGSGTVKVAQIGLHDLTAAGIA